MPTVIRVSSTIVVAPIDAFTARTWCGCFFERKLERKLIRAQRLVPDQAVSGGLNRYR